MPSFDGLLIVMAVAFAVPSCSAWSRACASPRSCSRSSWGSRSGPPCSGSSRWTRRSRSSPSSAWPSCSSCPGSRSTSTSCAGGALRLTAVGFVLSFAIAIVVSLGAVGGRARGHAAAGGDHPVRHVAGRRRRRAEGRGRGLVHLRAARDRRGQHRRLRRHHPAVAVLLRRGRHRRHAAAAGAARRARRGRLPALSAGPSGPRRSAPTWCACRTRPRRSACAPRCCCSSASAPSPRRSGSRRSSARSPPARSSRCWTATRS